MSKKHSVNVSFEEKDYNALKDLADKEDRKINAQARHMLRKDLRFEAAIRARAGIPQPDVTGWMPAPDDVIRVGVTNSGLIPDTSPDATAGELARARAQQEPLPG